MAFKLGVYVWGAPGTPGQGGLYDGVMNLPLYETWLGRPVDLIHDFGSADTWAGMASSYMTEGWEGKGRRLFASYKMLAGNYDRRGPTTGSLWPNEKVSLGEGAAGKYDLAWTYVANALVAGGHLDAIVRLGPEMNGGWERHRAAPHNLTVAYTGTPPAVGAAVTEPYLYQYSEWRGGPGGVVTAIDTNASTYNVYYDQPRLYAQYWRRIVAAMKAVNPNFKFTWCPTRSYQQFPAADCYPGDDVVDYISLDTYDEVYGLSNPTPAQRWNYTLNGTHELQYWCNFAKATASRRNASGTPVVSGIAKPFGIAEWGTNIKSQNPEPGGGDNPYYIQKMYDFITDAASNVQFALYFDVEASDGHHELSSRTHTTEFPTAAALYKSLFSAVDVPVTTHYLLTHAGKVITHGGQTLKYTHTT